MAITSVTRFKGRRDLSLVREAAPLFKKHGATMVHIGTEVVGSNAGEHVAVLTYPDWTTYGAGVQSLLADPDYESFVKGITEAGFVLLGRIIVTGEVT